MKRLQSLVLASLFAASAAQAGMVSYDAVYGPQGTDWDAPGKALTLQKFNPLLGTLTGITFNWRGNLASSFGAYNAGDDATVVDYEASGTMGFSIPTFGQAQLVFGPQTGQMALGVDESSSILIELLKTGSGTLSTGLTDFVGSGSFDVRVVARSDSSMREDSGNVDTTIRTSASAYAQVVYAYSPTTNQVPEPSSFALLGLALLAAGAASRRRS